jgi:hypothetical protein
MLVRTSQARHSLDPSSAEGWTGNRWGKGLRLRLPFGVFIPTGFVVTRARTNAVAIGLSQPGFVELMLYILRSGRN